MCLEVVYHEEKTELGRQQAPGMCPYCGGKVSAVDIETKWLFCFLPLCFKVKRKYSCSSCDRRLVLYYWRNAIERCENEEKKKTSKKETEEKLKIVIYFIYLFAPLSVEVFADFLLWLVILPLSWWWHWSIFIEIIIFSSEFCSLYIICWIV